MDGYIYVYRYIDVRIDKETERQITTYLETKIDIDRYYKQKNT